jgi:CRISPR-associated endonuclease/helicase Cas3
MRGKQLITLPDEIDHLVEAVYEEKVDVPELTQERLDKALMTSDGKTIAHTGQANQAIIGFPDDASWNDPARFVLYDEDEPGVHRTLMAQTRLGEDSVVVIPLWEEDSFDLKITPDFDRSKMWFLRALSLARNGVVQKLRKVGMPEGWKESPLLRNCFPLQLNADGRWIEDANVRLDNDVGLVYEPKESA